MWVVTLTYHLAPGEAVMNAWTDLLEPREASVANVPWHGVTITVWVDDAVDPIQAAVVALRSVHEVVPDAPVGVEVVTAFEHERRAEAPSLPALVSAPEAADILRVSRQRLHQLR